MPTFNPHVQGMCRELARTPWLRVFDEDRFSDRVSSSRYTPKVKQTTAGTRPKMNASPPPPPPYDEAALGGGTSLGPLQNHSAGDTRLLPFMVDTENAIPDATTTEKLNSSVTYADESSEKPGCAQSVTLLSTGSIDPVLSAPLPTYLLLILWLCLSCSIVLCNKYIISNLQFPYPATLTCWHLSAATIITQILARTTSLIDKRHGSRLSTRDFLLIIVPIGLLFSLSLVCNQLPYLTLSIAFIQMLKGLGPAFVLLAAWSLRLETPSLARCANIGVIVLGVTIATFGELKFALSGFSYQLLGLLFDGYRLGLTRKLMSGHRKLDPLVAFYYLAPVSAVLLAAAAWTMEWRSQDADSPKWETVMALGWEVLLGSAVLAFALNMVIMLLIGQTGPLTIPLCGELKNILIVASSMLFWGTVITPSQVIGYVVTSMGLVYYSAGDRIRASCTGWRGRWRRDEGYLRIPMSDVRA